MQVNLVKKVVKTVAYLFLTMDKNSREEETLESDLQWEILPNWEKPTSTQDEGLREQWVTACPTLYSLRFYPARLTATQCAFPVCLVE